MKTEQYLFVTEPGGTPAPGGDPAAQLVFVFGARDRLSDPAVYPALRARHPQARILLASTAGEIVGTDVCEDGIAVTAVRFDAATVRAEAVSLGEGMDARTAGRTLAARFPTEGLVHLFVLSDGTRVNGSELARGLAEGLPPGVTISGGLAGDGTRFEQTRVGLDEPPVAGRIAAVAFYGSRLRVGCGSAGGWTPFGPERTITRSDANVLYELDGKSALDLYKRYLGPHAQELPGSALRFPLCIASLPAQHLLVRTVLGVDEQQSSMTFAGDMPAGARARLMHSTYDGLIEGATTAAQEVVRSAADAEPDLVLCVSCVGRRIVLGQRIEEEIERIREVVGEHATLAGFYSYGELAPVAGSSDCELHNQTMTISLLKELS